MNIKKKKIFICFKSVWFDANYVSIIVENALSYGTVARRIRFFKEERLNFEDEPPITGKCDSNVDLVRGIIEENHH